jgi:hypothetical protein
MNGGQFLQSLGQFQTHTSRAGRNAHELSHEIRQGVHYLTRLDLSL